MARKRWRMCCLTSDDIIVEKHTKNSTTGTERMTKRSSTRNCVPIIDAFTRVVFAIGLVAASMVLALNMKPESLKSFENSNKEYLRIVNEHKLKLITYYYELAKGLTNISNDLAQVRISLEANTRALEGFGKYYHKCFWCTCCLWEGEGK
jgi:hypothetical protein